jgi:hypothetical protein
VSQYDSALPLTQRTHRRAPDGAYVAVLSICIRLLTYAFACRSIQPVAADAFVLMRQMLRKGAPCRAMTPRARLLRHDDIAYPVTHNLLQNPLKAWRLTPMTPTGHADFGVQNLLETKPRAKSTRK